MKSNFFFYGLWLWSYMGNLSPNKVIKFFSYVSSRSFTVFGVTFGFMIHFEFHCIDSLRHGFEVLQET